MSKTLTKIALHELYENKLPQYPHYSDSAITKHTNLNFFTFCLLVDVLGHSAPLSSSTSSRPCQKLLYQIVLDFDVECIYHFVLVLSPLVKIHVSSKRVYRLSLITSKYIS